ncbi:MAG TPA: amino acid adenylation domain-containing protein [Pseudomonas sp.]|uniref:non-ribosomal peptide synthetase n=1 Tax=Pseudomonas sp. TaxID=306 RepID=UPI002B870F64|nr:non-ribosomal peptide synthetase [Pseudomonas sp.]HSX86564.1 amino acid adenylation domain-containing protein [Pseudomonas sp.]
MEFDAKNLAERIAKLAPEKREGFIRALADKGIRLTRLPIVGAPRDGGVPLSYAQQRLWFLMQLEPDSAAYNMPAALRLCGKLDLAALQRSFACLVQRHEVLRSSFHQAEGAAEQIVHAALPLAIGETDLAGLPAPERERRLRQMIDTEANTPFDLSQGPLRLQVVRLAADEHALLLTAHHIVADAWSLGVLTRELAACYGAFAQGCEPTLPALPIQYADYALWQRNCLAGAALEPELAYWTAQLGGEQPVLELPSDRPRPKLASGRGGRHSLQLDAELSAGLNRLARERGTTLFSVLLAAFDVLLYRLSGQTDLRVGVPVANRTRVETEGLIGCFVNTLVLRAELDGQQPFVAWLDQVKATSLAAQAHQELPFERLVEALQPERDLSHPPLFQVLFNLLDSQQPRRLELPGLSIESIEREQSSAQFDLSLDMAERAGQLEACFSFNRDLFDDATVVRYAAGFERLLRGILANPNCRVGQLPLLSEAEQRALLAECQARMLLPAAQPVHLRLAAQAVATPAAPALVLDDCTWSYAELNQRANRIAHQLLALDLPAEARIGLCLPRGLEMVAALFGTLKAGLAFVPLDPDFPAERLAHMIEDAGIRLLLVAPQTLAATEAHGQLQRLEITQLDQGPDHDPVVAVHPAQLAYLMYTSGSTGKPKGVAIDHQALAGHSEVALGFFELSAADRVLQFSTFNFDGFVDQLFPALCCGACVVLRGPELWDSQEFQRRLLRHGISVADLATAYWYQLAQDFAAEPPTDCGALRLVSATGEAMPPEGLSAWRQAGLSRVRLLNTYGPTEATVTASVQDCQAWASGARPLPVQMPIGQALPGRAFYLLDRDGNLAPPGVPGELCIGGELLARGYHGRPALSAERFAPDPFGPPGSRLYRTGDLARRLADGAIEYLGRIDQQVKLRGFRIELGEIEARLQSHPAVRQALVLVREDRPGDRRLVAYVVPHGEAPAIDSLREHLAEALPDYMLPAAFVSLSALPLSPNGKLDRKALPLPEYGADNHELAPPRTAQERALAQVWQAVLGLQAIGIHDNFFALGGHSLLATQLVARLRRQLSIELPLRVVFEAPTIAQMAERLPASDAAVEQPIAVAPRPASGLAALPLSHAQQGMWFIQQLEPNSAAYHIPSAARLRGHLDSAALHAAFQALVRRHEALRTSFAEQDGELTQLIHGAVELPLPLIDLGHLPPAEREAQARRLLIEAATEPFDLSQAPLLRLTLVRLAADEHLLLLVLHHIVADGWSMGVLVSELAQLYRAALEDRAAALPALPIQYADYAAWQRQRLDGAGLERQLAYWRQALGEPQAPLDLPADRPRPAAMSGRGGRHRFSVERATASALHELCRQQGATLFMGLLGAFQIWLHAHSGRLDPIVGTDVANRGRAETEGVVGFFLNQLALRADLAGNPSFSALLARMRTQVLDAYSHQELPFDKLVEALNPVRSLAYSPLFQVKLVLQNQPEGALEMPGLEVLPEPIEHGQAQLDLHLTVEETERGLDCTFKYSVDLFEATTVAAFAEEFSALLAQVAAAPDTPLATLAQSISQRARERRLAEQQARSQQGLARLGGARRKSLLTTDSLEG